MKTILSLSTTFNFIFTCCFGFIFTTNSFAQNKYTSLKEALKNPEQVKVLSLENQNIERFPIEILKLKNLTHLGLAQNKLSSFPREIRQLKNLTWLNLRENKFTTLPKEVLQLNKLKTLYLGWNKISRLPKEIRQLKNLEKLNADGNIIWVFDNFAMSFFYKFFNQKNYLTASACVSHADRYPKIFWVGQKLSENL